MNQVSISLFLLLIVFSFVGCSVKEPEVVIKTQYEEKYIPVRCIETIPIKPIWDKNNTSYSYEMLFRYYETVERLLKGCVKHGEVNGVK